MKKIKVLNLYAGIGGNRKLWNDDLIEVTAVEIDEKIANIYKENFPDDEVIVEDAHQFLLEYYKEFDFVWSSPPCQSHSRSRFWGMNRGYKAIYPDMKLWQEIIFLQHYFKGFFVVENVIGFYPPFIEPQKIGRHYFWANFKISSFETPSLSKFVNSLDKLQKYHGFDLSKYKIKMDKRILLRNCVDSSLGLHIFNSAYKKQTQKLLSVSHKSHTQANPKKDLSFNTGLDETSKEVSQISANAETSLNPNIKLNSGCYLAGR